VEKLDRGGRNTLSRNESGTMNAASWFTNREQTLQSNSGESDTRSAREPGKTDHPEVVDMPAVDPRQFTRKLGPNNAERKGGVERSSAGRCREDCTGVSETDAPVELSKGEMNPASAVLASSQQARVEIAIR